MVSIQQKQSKCLYLITLILIIAAFILRYHGSAGGAIFDYSPDIDISMGMYDYFYTPNDLEAHGDDLAEIKPGIYFGGYLGLKSPLFTFFFDSSNIYTTYEAGIALNRVGQSNYYISIPLIVDLGYSFSIFKKKVVIYPFVGTGLNIVKSTYNNETLWQVHILADTGIEIKYLTRENTALKVKVSYGIMFVDEIESGFIQFLKVRFPVPFIP